MHTKSARTIVWFAISVLAWMNLPTSVIAAVSIRVADLWPPSPVTLSPRASLYVRVIYDSDQPLKLQAQGRLDGHQANAAMYNASQTYPAGHGEALVWIAYNTGGKINEIKAIAYDPQWRPITEASVPVQATWVTGA